MTRKPNDKKKTKFKFYRANGFNPSFNQEEEGLFCFSKPSQISNESNENIFFYLYVLIGNECLFCFAK